MDDKPNDCKCGKYKRDSDFERLFEKEKAILKQRIELLEQQIKEK